MLLIAFVGVECGGAVVSRASWASLSSQDSPPGPGLAGLERSLAPVVLLDSAAPADELVVEIGAGEQLAIGAGHPRPSTIDAPGRRSAAAGGPGTGGPQSYGERRYRERAWSEVWNGLRAYRQPRSGRARRAASDEWITRAPELGFDEQERRRQRAQGGAERGSRGVEQGVGQRPDGELGEDLRWVTADPVFDRGASEQRSQRHLGDVAPARTKPMVTPGELSSDTGVRGPTADDRRMAAASSVTDPDLIDLVSPSAGGSERGVRGDSWRLGNAPGSRPGRGTAASSTAAQGPGSAIRARRGDPYFRQIYRRIDRSVRYPRDLALALEQGQLVVSFVLDRRGRLAELRLIKPSGFEAFDRELLRAIRAAAPFGAVPGALLRHKARIKVLAPYRFRNPVIR